MQPLVPVAAPMISSPDNTGASGAAAAGGSGSGVDDEWHIEYNELETNKYLPPFYTFYIYYRQR